MSQAASPAATPPAPPRSDLPSGSKTDRRRSRSRRRAVALAGGAVGLILCLAIAVRAYRNTARQGDVMVPVVKVQKGDLSLTIAARGELKGQNPEVLAAPMTGGSELHITTLLNSGTLVKPGDSVVQFDTAEQEYKLREAEDDLAEAGQHILQARAQQQAQEEEDRYALAKAKTDVTLAELDARKNPLLAAIVARQNELALRSAREHLDQLQRNLGNRAATGKAAAAIQEAGRIKAETQARTARENIESMTLKAHHSGYVSIERNSSGNFFFFGMTLPFFQVGDSVRPGMAVATIPDLRNWEVEANIGELDRGHIAVGDSVAVTIIAVPNEKFTGHVQDIGGTTGPPWDRRFTCRLTLDRSAAELRPGISAELTITTDRLRQVLWLPAQAVFEADGRIFVYARSGAAFAQKDVKLVRRNDTRVVISGLAEGQEVALANPVELRQKKKSRAAALPLPPR